MLAEEWVPLGLLHAAGRHTPGRKATRTRRQATSSAVPGLSLQLPLLTKPNIAPASKGEMVTGSSSHFTKQGGQRRVDLEFGGTEMITAKELYDANPGTG